MDFVDELAQLIKKLPKHHLPMQDCDNCPYNSFLYKSKDCHLCYSSSFLKSCMYIDIASSNQDCVDGDYINKCELCYECVDCHECYNSNFCKDCKSCTDCTWCYECQGCMDCFGCVGLQKQKHHIFNKKYSPEEYKKKLDELKKLSPTEVQEKTEALKKEFPHRAMHTIGSEECFGEYVNNSKNCYMCFNAERCEDSMYLYDEMTDSKDCCDCTHIQECELCYNLMSAYQCYNVDASWWMVNCTDCTYGFCNNGCTNCFGCVNVQRKEYCILNKQYSPEEYEKKRTAIINDLKEKGLYGKYLLMDAIERAKTL